MESQHCEVPKRDTNVVRLRDEMESDLYWKDKPVSALSREELVEALNWIRKASDSDRPGYQIPRAKELSIIVAEMSKLYNQPLLG